MMPPDLKPGDTIRTEYEPRWHGLAVWTEQRVHQTGDGWAVLSMLKQGWVRRERGSRVRYLVERKRAPSPASRLLQSAW